MSRGGRSGIAVLVIIAAATVQARASAPIGLSISYPPPGTETRHKRIRIAGSCEPACAVSVNGRPVRVYPTGAFVDFVEIAEGKNGIEVCAEKEGRRRCAEIEVTCTDPIETSPARPATIDPGLVEPAADTVLQPGCELVVELKGSPGAKAFWSLGEIVKKAPMEEAAPAEDGEYRGVRGIYRASYRVRAGDDVRKGRVRFSLETARGGEVSSESPGRVTLLPVEKLSRGIVKQKGARLKAMPGGDMIFRLARGARVNICGRAGDDYCLKLSDRERFWTAAESVKEVAGKGPWGPAEVGPPELSPAKGAARLRVPVSGRPPARITQCMKDGTLVIELFGASLKAPPAEIRGVFPVERLHSEVGEGGVVRLIAHMEGRRQWGFRYRFDDKGLMLDVKKWPGGKIGGLTVVIDPGHGGSQTGAMSITGVAEKEFNLEIACALARSLRKKGATVKLTREDDSTLSLSERISIARRAGADIFVSIHNNSRPGYVHPLSRRGSDVFYRTPQSRGLAACILARLAGAGLHTNACARRNFAVILPTEYPAVLVECAYLSHPEDEAKLLGDGFAERIAGTIAQGIVDFLRQAPPAVRTGGTAESAASGCGSPEGRSKASFAGVLSGTRTWREGFAARLTAGLDSLSPQRI